MGREEVCFLLGGELNVASSIVGGRSQAGIIYFEEDVWAYFASHF